MTIEIKPHTNLLQFPTLQHQQGNFELLIKQQLENGSHQLAQPDTHPNPGEPKAPDAQDPASERSANAITVSRHSNTRDTAVNISGVPSLSVPVHEGDTGAMQTAFKPASKAVNALGISASFADLRFAPDIKRSHSESLTTTANRTDVTSNFKPANVLIIRGEQEVRLYIRDFFADEHELIRWAGKYMLDKGNDPQSPTQIYINGKPFRMNGSNLVQEEDRHGN